MAARKTMIEWERQVLAAEGAPERVAEIERELRVVAATLPPEERAGRVEEATGRVASRFPGLFRPTVLSGWCSVLDAHTDCDGGTCDCLCHP